MLVLDVRDENMQDEEQCDNGTFSPIILIQMQMIISHLII